MEDGTFKGLPEEIMKQLESSGIDKKQIQDHPEQVLQVLSFASHQAASKKLKEKLEA
jgi:hypothetical protein